MVALKDECTAHPAFQASEHAPATIALRPFRQTLWRRQHEIRAGGAPHFFTGAMLPELPQDNEVRVGYRNRVDDPEGSDYEYVGFVYRGYLRFADLPQLPNAVVEEAWLVLRMVGTKWLVGGKPARAVQSVAGHLLVLEAPLQPGDAAFYTPSYTYCALPGQAGTVDKASFSVMEGLKIDVASIVQAWLHREARNHGLMLVGPHESFERNNDVQESTYREIVLSISYRPGASSQ